MTDTIAVALVRLDQVDFHPHNVRQNLGDLRSLTASITRHGVMQPIVVEKHAGRLRLRAGHRRTAAARLAGLTRIPAVIHAEALEDDEWLIASVQENVHREQLSKADRKRTVQALLDLGCTREGIAQEFGVSAFTVTKWLKNEPLAPKASSPRLTKTELARRIADWRGRNVTLEVVLSELEQYATKEKSDLRASATARNAAVRARVDGKIESIGDLLRAGESIYAIAERLDTTVSALGRMLSREGQHELARPFNAAQSRDRNLRAVS